MKTMKKKGFTLVELLVVIAIIAILATVSIVGYTTFINKANISNDTAIAGELNTLLEATNVTDPIKSFDDVKDALYANGFYLANLNTKTNGCYFVWDKANNQILLVDGDFKVLFSKTEPSANKADWHFAVSDLSKVAAIEAAGYTVEKMITDVADIAAALAAGGEFHIDTSLVLDKENLLTFNTDGANVTLNLGNASLSTNGVLDDEIPINVLKGTVTINGGVIGAAGSFVDADGDVVNTPIQTEVGTTVFINDTVFNTNKDGFAVFAGNTTVDNATFNAEDLAVYASGSATVVLKNTTINSKGRCVWSCNLEYTNEETGEVGHVGQNNLIIESGTYTGGNNTYNPIVACGGKIEVKGGTFTNVNGGGIFTLRDASEYETIIVTGGTFNGVAFEELDTVDEWKALCNEGCTVVIANGVVTITK